MCCVRYAFPLRSRVRVNERLIINRYECAILTVMGEFDIPAVVAAMSRLHESNAKVFGFEGHRTGFWPGSRGRTC
jgi:hypothetical protein